MLMAGSPPPAVSGVTQFLSILTLSSTSKNYAEKQSESVMTAAELRFGAAKAGRPKLDRIGAPIAKASIRGAAETRDLLMATGEQPEPAY
jgi:hypothetical protein